MSEYWRDKNKRGNRLVVFALCPVITIYGVIESCDHMTQYTYQYVDTVVQSMCQYNR